jgi:hypothetical protein
LKEDIDVDNQAICLLPGDINNAESLCQRDDIMNPIPEARWDHKNSTDLLSLNILLLPNTTLDKAGFVECLQIRVGEVCAYL